MPSQKTASEPKKKTIKCLVLKPIGIDATEETIKHLERRAKTKGMSFTKKGLTTMIYPNKRKFDRSTKNWIEPEPVYVELDKDTAAKLSDAGAVRIDVRSL